MPVSRDHAVSYLNRVVEMLEEETFEPRDKALILASLAQVEVLLEIADRAKAGLPVNLPHALPDILEEFSNSAQMLSKRLGQSR
jgi:hypothetical protein